jgi:hypothetical protein
MAGVPLSTAANSIAGKAWLSLSAGVDIHLWTCWGVAPNPTYFFALMQKSMQKRSRLHLLIDPTAACSLKDK